MTLREIIYMIMDELKLMSDDSSFNEDHIKFLIDRYRASLLYQQYSKDIKRPISDSNYQSINLTLAPYTDDSYYGNNGEYYKSTSKIPTIMPFSNVKLYPAESNSRFNYKFSWVSKERFKYTGFNKWLKRIVYYSLGEDNYLYLKSDWEDLEPLEKITIRGIFESTDISEANSLDKEFPLEHNLIPILIQSVVQELAPKTVQPEDSYNNASDDKANLNTYLSLNTKSNLAKQLS